MIHVAVQTADIDLNAETAALRGVGAQVGGIATFLGVMRDINDVAGNTAQVNTLTLEHYEGMTQASLQAIAAQAVARFGLQALRVVHRVGTFAPSDAIVWVGVAASHRQAAFDGCAYVMDYLKTEAPFWKQETTPQGTRWVDARDSDTAAAARWQASPLTGHSHAPHP
jgi:molybdopterin synthase catalytic subunit